ncbi:hypothetical protein LB505_002183 [Fusarium chuoi]|nr:hypothetical protein LB505_002183 [Fusarium chuoi]
MSDPQRDAPPLSAHIPAATTTTTVLPTTNGSAKGDDVPDAGLRSLDHSRPAKMAVQSAPTDAASDPLGDTVPCVDAREVADSSSR